MSDRVVIPFLPPRGGLSNSNAGSVLRLDQSTRTQVENQLRTLDAQVRTLDAASRRINEAAVRRLSRYASKNLAQSIKARGREQLKGEALLKLAGDYHLNSTWTQNGFHFFDPAVVNRSPGRAKNYWRAIELGSRHMIGRKMPIQFYRGGRAVPNASEPRTDLGRLVRPTITSGPNAGQKRGKRANWIYILRPIPAYRYIDRAVQQFQAQQDYQKIFQAEINRVSKNLARALSRGGPGY